MRLSAAITLALTVVANAAALPQPVTNLTGIAATGYKNVAYFVNWVSFTLLFGKSPPLMLPNVGYLCAELQPSGSSCIAVDTRALCLCQCQARDRRGLSFGYLVRYRQALPY